jgi:hypothetical protein
MNAKSYPADALVLCMYFVLNYTEFDTVLNGVP